MNLDLFIDHNFLYESVWWSNY